MRRPIRIGNCSGFYGDRLTAMREMLAGGPLDVLTGDYLAELTMLILARARLTDPERGFAATFLTQLADCLELAKERGVAIVVNAGGLDPAGCARKVTELAQARGVPLSVAYVTGDDVADRATLVRGAPPDPLTLHAYLGCFGIAEALRGGAEVVVTGRVSDAALVCGPAAAWHGWTPADLDELAGAVLAGHVLECGAQACGGNYPFFDEVPGLEHPGFPLAEVAGDGSSVITKHPGTGGLVSVGTVTAQLLYEIGSPAYLGPDVTAHVDSVRLTDDGENRVRISGVRGSPPPAELKVSCTRLAGFHNAVTFLLTGLDIEAKATLLERTLAERLATLERVQTELVRLDRPDAPTEEQATALYRVSVYDRRPELVGRAFSAAAVELALASYPGFSLTAPPGRGAPYGLVTDAAIPATAVEQLIVYSDGRRVRTPARPGTPVGVAAPEPVGGIPPTRAPEPPGRGGPGRAGAPAAARRPRVAPNTRRVPLGALVGARSGDKGGTANVGVWVRDPQAYDWLLRELDADRLAELLPEARALPVRRYELPNLLAVNFVLPGLLGPGASASARFDPQGKGIAEWLRSRWLEIPETLLDPAALTRYG